MGAVPRNSERYGLIEDTSTIFVVVSSAPMVEGARVRDRDAQLLVADRNAEAAAALVAELETQVFVRGIVSERSGLDRQFA